jgi:transposase-like protein
MELKFIDSEQMKPELQTCPSCGATERIGIHSRKDRRYKCHNCNRTFTETRGTVFYGLHYPIWVIVLVLTLLAYGCPVQAIVVAFVIDERTVREWLERAGSHGKSIQENLVCAGQIEFAQIQADELCVNTQKGKVWMATAMDVFSRLFIWGEVSKQRSKGMILRVMEKIKAAVKNSKAVILFAVDGFTAYPKAILKTFYTKIYTGKRGRPAHKLWENIHIAQVIKSHKGRKLEKICRKVVHGSIDVVFEIIAVTQVGLGKINTAFIERLNATFRARMPSLVRRTRNLALLPKRLESEMFWTGVVYNFCTTHSSLGATPAVAAGIANEKWSIKELLFYKFPSNT